MQYGLLILNNLSQGVSGSIPRSVEVELQADLVGTAWPGDSLSVTGIVQVLNVQSSHGTWLLSHNKLIYLIPVGAGGSARGRGR